MHCLCAQKTTCFPVLALQHLPLILILSVAMNFSGWNSSCSGRQAEEQHEAPDFSSSEDNRTQLDFHGPLGRFRGMRVLSRQASRRASCNAGLPTASGTLHEHCACQPEHVGNHEGRPRRTSNGPFPSSKCRDCKGESIDYLDGVLDLMGLSLSLPLRLCGMSPTHCFGSQRFSFSRKCLVPTCSTPSGYSSSFASSMHLQL